MNDPSLLQPRFVLAVIAISLIGSVTTTLGAEEKFDSTIAVLDERGQIAPSAPIASPNSHTVDVGVGPGFSFNPDFVTIVAGDTVRWTWAQGNHTVTSQGSQLCVSDQSYCSPNNVNCATAPTSPAGSVYSHTFAQPGLYLYFCRVHCGAGMTGSIRVIAPFVTITSVTRTAAGHFVFLGQTVADAVVAIEASPDLVTKFNKIGTATADANGVFEYDDGSDPTRMARFYRAVLP